MLGKPSYRKAIQLSLGNIHITKRKKLIDKEMHIVL